MKKVALCSALDFMTVVSSQYVYSPLLLHTYLELLPD